MKRPNILWICTDQQRFDTIQALGNSHVHTPNLDRLARNGVSFNRAYTQSPICTPSRATFLTGRYPASHQVHRNGNEYFPPQEVLVTKLLAEAGYYCGLVGKLHLSRCYHRRENRPDDGYSKFYWSHHPQPDLPNGHDYAGWLENEKGVDPHRLFDRLKGQHYGTGIPERFHQTTWCAERSIQFIQEERDRPWLLSLNPFDPHPPFNPPAEYLQHYNPQSLPWPLFKESDIDHQKKFSIIDQQSREAFNFLHVDKQEQIITKHKTESTTAFVPPANFDARRIKACYYAMIELLDRQIGRIFDTLIETGQWDNTIVIFMSDHGELLGDHGMLYKGCRFFEALVHIPLIISWPEQFQVNRKSNALVELVDLAPTLLEAVGIEVPDFMQGSSLYPRLVGEQPLDYHKDHVICEYQDALDLPDISHATMYFDGRYKSIIYHGHELGELYDLEHDPNEFDDLWGKPEHREIQQELILKHFDAVMATSWAGITRSGPY